MVMYITSAELWIITGKKEIAMTKELLKQIKEFAEENWCKDESEQIYADDEEFAVANPWIDHSGRFPLDDVGAVKEWGLDVVLDFCEKAQEVM